MYPCLLLEIPACSRWNPPGIDIPLESTWNKFHWRHAIWIAFLWCSFQVESTWNPPESTGIQVDSTWNMWGADKSSDAGDIANRDSDGQPLHFAETSRAAVHVLSRQVQEIEMDYSPRWHRNRSPTVGIVSHSSRVLSESPFCFHSPLICHLLHNLAGTLPYHGLSPIPILSYYPLFPRHQDYKLPICNPCQQ